MSDEYIRKAKAIEEVNCALDRETLLFSFVRKVTISTLKRLPSADVAPVVHSRWVLGGYDDMYYICEKCGHKQSEYYVKPTANFCPNCGAKMDAQGEE